MAAAIGHFQDQGVDGMVINAPTHESLEAALQARSETPCVLITSGRVSQPGATAVTFDQEAGARAAMAHLIEYGHSAIAHLAGPLSEFEAQGRMSAWAESLALAGFPPGALAVGAWRADVGYQEAMRLLSEPNRPTAFFCGNDQMATGALRAAHELGLRVPKDLSVVGFDNMPTTDQLIPPLTTVSQDYALFGEAALEALIRLIGEEPASPHLVQPRLVVRASAGPVPVPQK